jgi:hypothetical protein
MKAPHSGAIAFDYSNLEGTVLEYDPAHKEAKVRFDIPDNHPERFLGATNETWLPANMVSIINS